MPEPSLSDPNFDLHRDAEPQHSADRRAQRVNDAILIWQDRLNLADWDIRYDRKDPNAKRKGSYQARTHFRYQEKVAQVRVDPALPDDEVEAVVAHELLHLVIWPYTDLAQSFAGAHKNGTLLLDLLHNQEEQIIEAIVRSMRLEGSSRYRAYGALAKTWPAFTE